MEARHKSNIWDVATAAGVAQGQEMDLAHIMQSCIIHIHTDVGLILPKLGMCPWIIHCSLN